MGKVIRLHPPAANPPVGTHFDDVTDPEGTGTNCAVLAAVMEDSMGGMDEKRFEAAMETCGCDLCGD